MNSTCSRCLPFLSALLISLFFAVLRIDAQEASLPVSGDLNAEMVQAFRGRSFHRARSLAEAAWDNYGPLKEGRDAGIAAANLGAIHALYGRLDEATDWQDRAEGFFEATGDTEMLGKLAIARALTAYIASRQFGSAEPEEAIGYLETARSHLGDRAVLECESEILLRSNQGLRVDSGYKKYLASLRASEARGDSVTLARCATRLGWLEGGSGGHSSAERLYRRAYRIYMASGNEDAALLAQRNAGVAQWKGGKQEEAVETFHTALKVARGTTDLRLTLMLFNDLAMLSADMEKEDRAIEYDRKADAALAALSRELESGRLEESVVLDFTLLLEMRYAGRETYVVDLFDGFYEYLALIPEGKP